MPWVLGHDADNPGRAVAIVESALAIGLCPRRGPAGNDPVRASSVGLGQLVAAAVQAGAKQVLIGVGGSATTDGGLGAVDALAPSGRPPKLRTRSWPVTSRRSSSTQRPFLLLKRAPRRHRSSCLKRRLERVAQLYEERFGVDVRAIIEQRCRRRAWRRAWRPSGPSSSPVSTSWPTSSRLAERIATADLVVTGEGYLDEQSFAGKAVGGVARLAALAGVPVLIVAGDGEPDAPIPFVSMVERFGADARLVRRARPPVSPKSWPEGSSRHEARPDGASSSVDSLNRLAGPLLRASVHWWVIIQSG